MTLTSRQETLERLAGDGGSTSNARCPGLNGSTTIRDDFSRNSDVWQYVRLELERHIDISSLRSMAAMLSVEMEERCRMDTQTMLPSFVRKFTHGAETGDFLCLDIGGSTLRVGVVRLLDNHLKYGSRGAEVLAVQLWPISEELKMLKEPVLFQWIGQTVAHMVNGLYTASDKRRKSLRACLTWSFPLEQTDKDRATVQSCGKGFRVFDELAGHDIVRLLEHALENEGLPIRLEAIVNDAVAGLLTGNRDMPSMITSVVLGTGLNAAAKVAISKIDNSKYSNYPSGWSRGCDFVLVNTELSLFGSEIFPRTGWDDLLIQNVASATSCFQPLEYMCSGYYIGETFRLILIWAIDSGCLLGGVVPEPVLVPFSLQTSLLAILEGDSSPDSSVSAAALAQYFGFPASGMLDSMELGIVKEFAHSVFLRAAAYTSTAIYALNCIAKVDQDEESYDVSTRDMVIGVSGAMFEKFPGFKDKCQVILNDLAGYDSMPGDMSRRFVLEYVVNGSLIGSALASVVE